MRMVRSASAKQRAATHVCGEASNRYFNRSARRLPAGRSLCTTRPLATTSTTRIGSARADVDNHRPLAAPAFHLQQKHRTIGGEAGAVPESAIPVLDGERAPLLANVYAVVSQRVRQHTGGRSSRRRQPESQVQVAVIQAEAVVDKTLAPGKLLLVAWRVPRLRCPACRTG